MAAELTAGDLISSSKFSQPGLPVTTSRAVIVTCPQALPITNLLDFLLKLLSLIEDNEHILLHFFSLQHTIQAEFNSPRVQCRKVGIIFFWQPLHWLFYLQFPISSVFPRCSFRKQAWAAALGYGGRSNVEQRGQSSTGAWGSPQRHQGELTLHGYFQVGTVPVHFHGSLDSMVFPVIQLPCEASCAS